MMQYPFVLSAFEGIRDFTVTGVLQNRGDSLECSLHIQGDIPSLIVPLGSSVQKKEGLWFSSCVEIFVKESEHESYVEWNFSPSGEWWVMDFSGYRQRRDSPALNTLQPDLIVWDRSQADGLTCRVRVPSLENAFEGKIGIACVLATAKGLTHWSLKHSGTEPDFHDERSFVLEMAMHRVFKPEAVG